MKLRVVARSLLPLVLIVCAGPLFSQQLSVYRSTSDLKEALHREANLSFSETVSSNGSTIVVDDDQRFQTMDGFGASLTDGSAWLLHDRLPADERKQVMTQLFDPQRGIGLSFLRQPIGSSDLSRDHYSFDDLPEGKQDPKLKKFSAKHDNAYVFPMIREALKLNPSITVMATPWSAPAWMKTRPTMNGGSLREDAMAVYASYLVRSVQAFQKTGVPVKYLSVQNEPLYETKNYPGTLMLAEQSKRLIGSYLGPELRRAGLSTQILAYDHNWNHPEYPIKVLSDSTAAPFVAGSALHCYGGDVSAQETIHQKFPDKGIWETECSGGTWQHDSPLLTTARLLIGSSRNWAKSVVLWTMVLDTDHNPHAGGCGTCRGLVTLDLRTSPVDVTYNGDYYGLGHASKFVHPGATRIGSTSFGSQGLETVAFQNSDGSVALLVLNNRTEETPFVIQWHGHKVQTSLSAESLATYTWPSAR